MGLKKSNSNTTFLKVRNGKLATEVSEGGQEITVTNPSTGESVTKRYDLYNSLTGYFTGVSIFNGMFGESLKVSLKDENDVFVIDMSLESDYALDFLKRLPNLVKGEEIKVSPVISEAKDKEGNQILNKKGEKVYNYYMSIQRILPDGETESVKSFYNAENPLPEWNTVTINGKKKLDKTDYINALKMNVKELQENE